MCWPRSQHPQQYVCISEFVIFLQSKEAEFSKAAYFVTVSKYDLSEEGFHWTSTGNGSVLATLLCQSGEAVSRDEKREYRRHRLSIGVLYIAIAGTLSRVCCQRGSQFGGYSYQQVECWVSITLSLLPV